MSVETPLHRSESAIVGATGIASVEVGPASSWTAWKIRRVAVRLSTGSGIAATYRNVIGDASLIDATSRGDSDVAEYIDPLHLSPGDRIVVRWQQAQPGSRATVVLTGSEVRS